MALIRPIRPLPIKPTAEMLRNLMRKYGIKRARAARLMRCSPSTVSRYLRAEGAPGALPIPLGRFELLMLMTAIIYCPDEPVEMSL